MQVGQRAIVGEGAVVHVHVEAAGHHDRATVARVGVRGESDVVGEGGALEIHCAHGVGAEEGPAPPAEGAIFGELAVQHVARDRAQATTGVVHCATLYIHHHSKQYSMINPMLPVSRQRWEALPERARP